MVVWHEAVYKPQHPSVSLDMQDLTCYMSTLYPLSPLLGANWMVIVLYLVVQTLKVQYQVWLYQTGVRRGNMCNLPSLRYKLQLTYDLLAYKTMISKTGSGF